MTTSTAPTVNPPLTSPDTFHGPSMLDRVPAQALLEQVLRLQAVARPRTPVERLVGRSPLHPEARSWFVGALGERAVASRLALLPAGWTVLHSLPVGRDGADIDHLVVGPGGVFTVTTKHHVDASVWVAGGTVLVAGERQPYLPRAEADARRIDRIVAGACAGLPAVRPVVAIVGAARLTRTFRPRRVAVVRAEHLRRWLLRQPVRLEPQDVAALTALLERPDTWQPAAEADPALLLAFGRLRHEVGRAERARLAWALAGAGGVLAAAAAAVTTVLTHLLAAF